MNKIFANEKICRNYSPHPDSANTPELIQTPELLQNYFFGRTISTC
jgi:hypothetical protein